jgi:LmbE family N-acetylglucosaminyl deacetylase
MAVPDPGARPTTPSDALFPGLTSRRSGPNTGGDAGPRLLVVVAHPDDETFGTGSLLLRAAAEGYRTAVCCATRGEAGDPTPGTVVGVGGLGALREAELHAAATLLGVDTVRLLDFTDSGMVGDPAPGTLAAAAPDAVLAEVAACVDDLSPDVIVTLDGADGHRDHVVVRDATVAVGDDRGIPVWLHCLPRELMQQWVDHMNAHRPQTEHLTLGDLGTPDELIEHRLDTTPFLADRERAITLHGSQSSPFEGLPAQLRRAFLTSEHLCRPPAR